MDLSFWGVSWLQVLAREVKQLRKQAALDKKTLSKASESTAQSQQQAEASASAQLATSQAALGAQLQAAATEAAEKLQAAQAEAARVLEAAEAEAAHKLQAAEAEAAARLESALSSARLEGDQRMELASAGESSGWADATAGSRSVESCMMHICGRSLLWLGWLQLQACICTGPEAHAQACIRMPCCGRQYMCLKTLQQLIWRVNRCIRSHSQSCF